MAALTRIRSHQVRGSVSLSTAVRSVIETLEDRRLLSATLSSSLLAFNSVSAGNSGSGASRTQTLLLTNTGSAAINISGITIANDPSVPNQDASQFNVTNLGSVPGTLGAGQSFGLNVNFTATSTGLHSALLQVSTSDPGTPVVQSTLRGLGTTGLGGGNEPSLAAILREYQIPTIVGDGPNDSNAFASTFYPATPDASSQEISMQRLVKAGNGPVTITPLATFAVANQPTLRFGTYVPGDAADTTQLFFVSSADSQTVNATLQGITSFDPGSSEFGLYANFPTFTDNGHQRMSYSEDALNTWDANVSRKVRFFPLENADGSAVPNAYIFAAEDNNIPFGNIQPYDSNDMVGIIRNVSPAASGATLGLQNLSGAPSTTRLVFNRIQNKNPANPSTFTDFVHDTNTLQLENTGTQPLVINSLTLSDTTNWELSSAPTLPVTLAVGQTLDVTVKFIATTVPPHTGSETNNTITLNGVPPNKAGAVSNATLTIGSNDAVRSTRTVDLAGYWQNMSENENEPGLKTIIGPLFGYGTTISTSSSPDLLNSGTTPVYYGEEVPSALWNVADPTLPVSVRQLVAFHSQFDGTTGNPTSAIMGWYPQGGSVKALFQDPTGQGQTVLGTIKGSTTAPAQGSFSPNGVFGLWVDGEYSQDSRNTVDMTTYGRSGHAVRFYPARDGSGTLIANTWLCVLDYENGPYDNSDYQDLVVLISNMRPNAQAPAPQAASATVGQGNVTVQWTPVGDSALQGYNVYRSDSANGTFTKLNGSPITGFSYTDGSAPTGVSSFYRVTAVDASGESLGTPASVLSGPPAPTNVVATAQGTSGASVTWAAAAGATSYDVYRQAAGDPGFTQATTGLTKTSFTDSGLASGTTYTYEVRAIGATGASGFTLASPITTGQGVGPTAPTGLAAVAVGSSTINLTWTDTASDETGFLIERSTGGSSFAQIAALGPNVTSYSDVGLNASTTYVYRVRATNGSATSAYTLPQAATTTAPVAGAPANPTNLAATPSGQTQISLTWTDNTAGAASFNIVRAIGTGGFTQLATVAAGVTSYLDSTVVAGTTYVYEVQAALNGLVSDFSNSASATTTASASGGFKVNLGAGASRTLKFRDADGTLATIVWKGPGSAVLSFGGSGLSQSTLRGVTTVASAATLDLLTASGTTGGTSITITTRGGNKSITVGGLTFNGALGRLAAPGANLAGIFTASGAIGQLLLSSATGGTITAPSIRVATFGGVFGDALNLTALGAFRAGSIAGGNWAITSRLASLSIRSTFAAANIAAGSVGTISLGKIITANVGLPFGLTLHSAKSITGSANGKHFSLRRITSTTNVPALLTAQHVSTGDFSIQAS